LSTIIRSYKSAVTHFVNENFPEQNFEWQSRFHDHIIRNKREYYRIVQYIRNNPLKWKEK
jgi:putative transposase